LQQEEEQIMKYQGKTIHKSINNTWYTRYRFNGKQYYISAKTQKDCYDKLVKAIKGLKLGVLSVPARETKKRGLTLSEWFEKWIDMYKRDNKIETIRDYRTLLKNVKSLKNKEMQEITIEDIIKALNKMTAERQKQKVWQLLNMMYKKALDNEIVDKNIMVKIDKPKHTKQNGDALSHEQEEQFIEVCQKCKYGDLYLVALHQGLRKGEVLGITDKDIDFENNTLTINKAINRHNKFDTTKNDVSIRTMPLFNPTRDILLKYKNVKGRIFDISYHRIDNHTKELNAKLDFYFSLKYMRFTFITRCQEQNIPEFVIQAWCGHQIGSKVTRQVYTKYKASDNTKYINIFNESKNYSKTTHKKK